MFTEAAGNTVTYNQSNPTESIWDSGTSSWDLTGNVEASLWDVTSQAYTETSDNSISLVEQSGDSVTYTEQSGNTPSWIEQ